MRAAARRGCGGSLSVRGQLLNTFGPFGAIVALVLLAGGFYLIDQQLLYPLQSSDVGLIFGAVLLATSLALFAAVLRPNRRPARRKGGAVNRLVPAAMDGVGGRERMHAVRQGYESHLERYVDGAQIRLAIPRQARGMAGK
jgi:hypothetical protein